MKYQFIQVPKFIEPKAYQNTIDRSLSFLSKEKAIASVYKMGNVNHPGISDIDLYAVFKNGEYCSLRPENHFNRDDKYLITHSIAGASEKHFLEALNYTLWDNLECIYGKDLLGVNKIQVQEEVSLKLEVQTALEFLYKHFIDLSLQLSYGVVKLRTVLQHIKGVRYDLKFLKMENSKLQEYVNDVIEMLDNWFERKFSPVGFSVWLQEYYTTLKQTLRETQQKFTLYLPNQKQFKYGKNVNVFKSKELEFTKNGIFLKSKVIGQNKKIFNLHQRLNSFEFKLPYEYNSSGSYLDHRFNFFTDFKNYNLEHFPYFNALFPSLNHQLI